MTTTIFRFVITLARVNIHDQGIGAFDLISRGYHLLNNYDTAQVVETSVHGTTVNETRFQFHRWGYSTYANTPGAGDSGAGSVQRRRGRKSS